MRAPDTLPGVTCIDPASTSPLRDLSFQYVVNTAPYRSVETKWHHIPMCTTPTGDTQQEEECVVNVALRELEQNGYSVTAESCNVLHIRELRYEAQTPDEVQKSKLFLVLAGPNLLVSVCDGKSRAIERFRDVTGVGAEMTPVALATEIIKEAIRPIRWSAHGLRSLHSAPFGPCTKIATQRGATNIPG